MASFCPAIFLDRDGVLIEDSDLLTDKQMIRVLEGVPSSLQDMKQAGYKLIVVSNQPVVARGLLDEAGVMVIQEEVNHRLIAAGGPELDAFYFCPHHPQATLPAYRLDCDCRKPKPGMLLRAAREHELDLARSFMVGDRITDIVAGYLAGCRTILVKTGRHLAPPIQSDEPLVYTLKPDFICADLPAAVQCVLEAR